MAVNRYHVEAWSLPLETTAKIVGRVPFVSGSFADELSAGGVSRGELVVRGDWDRLTDVTDPDNDVESLLRVFKDNVLVGSFFGRRFAKNLADTGLVTITGPGLPSVLQSAEIENYDYPTRPTVDPDWAWGNGRTISGFRNGSFEESEDPEYGKLHEVGSWFEDQTSQGWRAIPAGGDFVDNVTAPTVDNGDAKTGTYSLTWDSGKTHSGIRKRVTVQGGESYTFTGWFKDATAGGTRFTFGVDFPTGATASHTNAYTENGISKAELGNAVKAAGATDGTWQQADLAVTFPTFSANEDNNWRYIYLYWMYDEHDTSTGPAGVRIDQVTGTGPGFGLAPWLKGGDPVTTFEQSTTHVDSGTYSAHLVTTGGGNRGCRQYVDGITPGRTYTFTAKIYHAIGSNQDFTLYIKRFDGRTNINTSTVSVPTATWTTLTVTGVSDVEKLVFNIRKDTAGEFWIDSADVYEGQGPASWGTINTQLLDDLSVNHTGEAGQYALDALGFLDYTGFSGTLDSAGNAWAPSTVEYRARRGLKMSQIATDGQRAGFEYYVTDSVTTGPALDIYNPYDWTAKTGGKGTVQTGVPDLRYGAGVTSGPIVKSPAGANRVHIEGEDGMWDVRIDATKISAFGTRMLYEGDPDLLGDDTLGQVADRLLEERTVPVVSLKVNIDPGDNPDCPTPYTHFWVGDTYPIDLAGDFVGSKRVVKITTDFTVGHGRYTVEFDQQSYTSDPQKALTEAVRRLLEKVDELDAPEDDTEPLTDTNESPATGIGPIEATYLLVGDDVRTELKGVADFVAAGSADEETIQLALTAAGAHGRVVAVGNFYISTTGSPTLSIPQECVFQGLGQFNTYIHTSSAAPLAITTGTHSYLGNMRISN